MGHSFDQRPMHTEPDAPAMIEKTVKTIQDFTGKPPVGRMGPGLTETYDTIARSAESLQVIKYICDWAWDDEPCRDRQRKAQPAVHAAVFARDE